MNAKQTITLTVEVDMADLNRSIGHMQYAADCHRKYSDGIISDFEYDDAVMHYRKNAYPLADAVIAAAQEMLDQ